MDLKKLQLIKEKPELAVIDELETINTLLEEIKNKPDIDRTDEIVQALSTLTEEVKKKDTHEDFSLEIDPEEIRGPQGVPGKDGKSIQGPKGRDGRDGKDGDKGDTGDSGPAGKDGSPDTPEQVRDKLSSLIGEQRLDKTAIKGLEQLELGVQAFSVGYQQVDARIRKLANTTQTSGSYLPLTGGTMTGTINFSSALNSGNILSLASAQSIGAPTNYTFKLGGGSNTFFGQGGTTTFKMEDIGSSVDTNHLVFDIGVAPFVASDITFKSGSVSMGMSIVSVGTTFQSYSGYINFTSAAGIQFSSTGANDIVFIPSRDVFFNPLRNDRNFYVLGQVGALTDTSISVKASELGIGAVGFGFIPSGSEAFLGIKPTSFNMASGTSSGLAQIGMQAGKQIVTGGGTAAEVFGLRLNTFNLLLNAGHTVTDLATLVINGAPTSSGTGTLTNTANAIWVKGGQSLFQGNVFIKDTNVIFGTTTGSQLGTSVSQKVSFHGATPVAQRSGAAQAAVSTTGATNVVPYGFTTAAQADAIVTLVNEIRATLVEKGLMKGSS